MIQQLGLRGGGRGGSRVGKGPGFVAQPWYFPSWAASAVAWVCGSREDLESRLQSPAALLAVFEPRRVGDLLQPKTMVQKVG